MSNKIQLSPKKILNKQFQVEFKGYNAQEVDMFLDVVADDYQEFADLLNDAYEENETIKNEKKILVNKIAALEKEIVLLRGSLDSQVNQNSNVDILKRISTLEKAVFGQK